MAYAFITSSDSLYKVEDGKLSRIGDGPIVDSYGDPHPDSDKLQDVRVRVVIPPRVGHMAQFRIPSGDFEGRLTTSVIKGVFPIVET